MTFKVSVYVAQRSATGGFRATRLPLHCGFLAKENLKVFLILKSNYKVKSRKIVNRQRKLCLFMIKINTSFIYGCM